MKAQVIKEFVDKHTGELHRNGSSFFCDEKRFEEIKSAGDFVKEIPETKKKGQ